MQTPNVELARKSTCCMALVLGVLVALAGCQDHDDEPDGNPRCRSAFSGCGGEADAGSHDAQVAADATTADSASADGASHDADLDSGDASCPQELVQVGSVYGAFEVGFTATRVPLDVRCPNDCRASEILSDLTCVAFDAGDDAGTHLGRFIRTTGCGRTAYSTPGWLWARHFNLDSESGELLGFASMDDIDILLEGTSCRDAAYVAGEIFGPCADVTVELCD
jgi:hypothetical protein